MSDPSSPDDPPDSDDGNDHGVDQDVGSVDPVERLEVWCAGEDWCPVTTTATLIGKKWHPVIIHRLLEHGPSGFNELQDAVDGISSKVLSDSLEDLQENRLVEREIISEKPFRVRYSLTDHGRSLEPVIYSMRDWGVQHLASPD
ncbi:winged helix-turn-helix transcriptional regulator [Halopenitus persicus]|uniref:winged helix-turn-helix transcriptional regulator n=1 Tax=Halopenitus persicus TaxID=1048396 RepID=UPI000BBAE6B7|nr:helix-turn-helix domain-containing protein [Halopenitus persicus]